MEYVTKTPSKHVFHTKQFEKHGCYKSLPKANKTNKNLFGLIHIWLSTHITFDYVQSHK